MSRKTRTDDDNGFAEWGGYMEAKKAKLIEQYNDTASNITKKLSNIFDGIAIFVNGYTNPTAEELKYLMAAHGGVYHHYQMSGSSRATTHIIASNLPNVKIKQLGSTPIVKPNWITESISAEKLLDFRKYLLYTNQNSKQPTLDFPIINKEIHNETESVTNIKEVDKNTVQVAQNAVENKSTSSRTLTAADPRFLAEFYNNSRLHLISTLGAEYKQLVTRMREKSDGKFPGRNKLKGLNSTAKFHNNGTIIMHIDMDCFFVSVGLRNRPELRGQPVAVTHAKGSQGANRSEATTEAEYALLNKYFPDDGFEKLDPYASMSEIASCSYEARKCGVRNGMFLGSALKLCPNLQTIPYNFQGYREVSHILYNTIAAYTLDIEAVSCDEMYVDVTKLLHDVSITVEQWATHIRKEIIDTTGCPCSTGFGENRLQARLATKKAKPAGQFHLEPDEVENYMAGISLADLPGVGHATVNKLNALGLKTCGDVQTISLSRLQADLGPKTAETLVEQARGIDRKPLNFEHERKSVSADVNYGIRFKDKTEALNFLQSLSEEVCHRLQDTGMKARCLTLKLLIRAPEAPQETAKFLGCGICNAVNRSTTTGSLISDAVAIFKEAKILFERINAPPSELRGVGIQLTKLEKAPPVNSALSRFLQQKGGKKKEINSSNNNDNTNKISDVSKSDTEKLTSHQLNLNEIKSKNEVKLVKTPEKKPTIYNNKKDKAAETKTKLEKRGRPKNNANDRLKRKPSNDLDKYFKRQTKPPSSNNTNDIDINVLNELPKYLQQEIIKEYGLENKIMSESLPRNDHCNNKKSPESLTPTNYTTFDGLDREELKPIILNWLHSETKPADIDVIMVGDHYKKLVLERKIEDVKMMCSFLYRHVAKTGLCSWHDAYLTITNMVLDGMFLRYGGPLIMERKFNCENHK